eukprot:jgi/Chrpa1/19342/Chrysochromulina_OHIO_Genome00024653-RA
MAASSTRELDGNMSPQPRMAPGAYQRPTAHLPQGAALAPGQAAALAAGPKADNGECGQGRHILGAVGSTIGVQSIAEPDAWLQHLLQRTTRRSADGSRTAQIASHGRLTACRSRLVRYPDRADDWRASLFLRRGALCILACFVHSI